MECLLKFDDDPTVPDVIHEYSDTLRGSARPIVIDNGSYKCRAGWAGETTPRLIFRNLTARLRTKKGQDSELLIGNSIANVEAVRWQIKTAFERNIVTQFDTQEQIFDYIFSHLGLDTDGSVAHPLVITEPALNPVYCREKMSELLFECYRCPVLSYGIDSLFSLYANPCAPHPHPDPSHDPRAAVDALVVSCGYHSTQVLPVLDGRLRPAGCRRLNVGGVTVDGYMQRTLQLKYPGHVAALTLSRAEELVQRRCHVAVDFESELYQWMDDDYYSHNVYKIQLPYTQQAAASVSAEQQRERREQQARRLTEINRRRRQQKLAVEQARLVQLTTALELATENTDDDLCGEGDDEDESRLRVLAEVDMMSIAELRQAIVALTASIQKLKDKMAAYDENAAGDGGKEGGSEESQSKRARGSLKTEPAIKRPRAEQKSDIGKVPPESDAPARQAWLEGLRAMRQTIVTSRAERRQRRAEMTKRRTHASQARMKMLSELAQNTKQKDDTFGVNDDDWDIYKHISNEGGDSDSEAESDRLAEIESYLRVYDPLFKDPSQQDAPFDIAEYYRLHIALEQIRIPELLFQPSMVGVDQKGLAETIEFVLSKFSSDEQDRLAQNVFLTGGCAGLPGLATRLEAELHAIRPFQSTFSVRVAARPVLDAWHGASQWAVELGVEPQTGVTLEEYRERGAGWVKEHCAGNSYTQVN